MVGEDEGRTRAVDAVHHLDAARSRLERASIGELAEVGDKAGEDAAQVVVAQVELTVAGDVGVVCYNGAAAADHRDLDEVPRGGLAPGRGSPGGHLRGAEHRVRRGVVHGVSAARRVRALATVGAGYFVDVTGEVVLQEGLLTGAGARPPVGAKGGRFLG